MSFFGDKEKVGGAPRWLYVLTRADQVFRLTSDVSPVTVPLWGLTFEPGILARDRLERDQERRADAIALRVSRISPLADALREVRSAPMTCRIFKYQPGSDTSAPIVEAFGDVANVRLASTGWIAFDLLKASHRFDQPFPTKLIERQCQWPAFSAESGIDERDFSFATTITNISDAGVITVASLGLGYTGYYSLGQMKFFGGIGAERMFVDYHEGTAFHLVGALPQAVLDAYAAFIDDDGPPVPVTLIAGDDKTFATRRDRFGAIAVDRFLGFDLLPTTDPLQIGVMNAPRMANPYSTGAPPAPPPSSGALPFRMFPTLAETDADATVRVAVSAPEGAIESVEWRSNPTGFAGGWTAWDDMPILTVDSETSEPTSWEATALKGDGGFVAIEVRVTYLDSFSVEQVATGAWAFSAPFYEEGRVSPNIDDPDEQILTQPFSGAGWYRAFVTLTDDADFWPDIWYKGQKVRLFVDATGGPFTLALRPALPDTTAMQYYEQPGATPITSITVDGIGVIDITRLYSDDPRVFDVEVVTGDVTLA